MSPVEVLRPNQIEVLRLIQIVLLNRVDQRLLSALFGFVLQEDKLGQLWHIQCLDQICSFENINDFFE